VKAGGGNAGHNGLRSISAHIGNEYPRVRIGVGHPGSKDLVSHYVLHDFARADQEWLGPMLDAMADAAGRLAAGDAARFLTDVARKLQPERGGGKGEKGGKGSDSVALADAEADVPTPRAATTAPAPPPGHPAGERQSKRGSALAENLKRWLRGNRGPAS
jgi:PTH1 family peptidyl-tRNA hydrolase